MKRINKNKCKNGQVKIFFFFHLNIFYYVIFPFMHQSRFSIFYRSITRNDTKERKKKHNVRVPINLLLPNSTRSTYGQDMILHFYFCVEIDRKKKPKQIIFNY